MLRLGFGQRRHQRHDEGLRDGLPGADGQRPVVPCLCAPLRADEMLARHRTQRLPHARARIGQARALRGGAKVRRNPGAHRLVPARRVRARILRIVGSA